MDDVAARLRVAGCVFAEDEAELLREAAGGPDLDALVARRVAGEPLEHVVGWAEFAGLRVGVGPGVFVPRPRTELLAEQAVRLAQTGEVVLDMCCGAGALGLVVATRVPGVRVHAADVDPVAVGWARRNLAGVGGAVHEGDLYDALPPALRGRVALLVVNAPYVPTGSIPLMPAEARLHEPRVALDGGVDGLDVQRRVAAGCRDWLAPGGYVLVETSAAQARVTRDLLQAQGLSGDVVHDEELDATVVVGAAIFGSATATRP